MGLRIIHLVVGADGDPKVLIFRRVLRAMSSGDYPERVSDSPAVSDTRDTREHPDGPDC